MRIDARTPLLPADSTSEVRSRPAQPLPERIVPPTTIDSAGLARKSPQPSLQDDLQALEHAAGVEPGLFAGSRPGEILEDILERILPTLPLDGDTRSLAMALVREELEIRQALDRQRLESEVQA